MRKLEFGAVLKRMRKQAGMSQECIAERLHISRSNVSRLEGNKLELKAADLIKWAKETNSQDVLVALVLNVDVAGVTHMLSSLLQTAGTIIKLGGIL